MNSTDEEKLQLLKTGPIGLKKLKYGQKNSNKSASGRKRKTTETAKPLAAPALLTVPDFDFGSEQAEQEVIFKPNPGPQTEFLAASEREVLYGGSAGGKPKSWFSASFRSNTSK